MTNSPVLWTLPPEAREIADGLRTLANCLEQPTDANMATIAFAIAHLAELERQLTDTYLGATRLPAPAPDDGLEYNLCADCRYTNTNADAHPCAWCSPRADFGAYSPKENDNG